MPVKKKEVLKEDTHKGYNEKNPAQPQGAFEPDSKKTGEKPPVKNTLKAIETPAKNM